MANDHSNGSKNLQSLVPASAADISEALRGLGRALDTAHVQLAEEGNPLARPFDALIGRLDRVIDLVADREPAEALAKLGRFAVVAPVQLVVGLGSTALALVFGARRKTGDDVVGDADPEPLEHAPRRARVAPLRPTGT
jgi:hypothetical protein